MSESNCESIEHYHRANRLKLRVGGNLTDHSAGRLDPKAIEAADQIVKEAAKKSGEQIVEVIENLSRAWSELRDLQEAGADEREIIRAQKNVFYLAHDVKDKASLCGYSLITDFAESLRDFIERIDLDMGARRIIVQAHVDTLSLAIKSKIFDKGNPMASQLWDAVQVAIEKHS